MLKDEVEIGGIVGDYTWQQTRDVLVKGLNNCLTEQDFLYLMEGVLISMGGKEAINEARSKLNLKPLNEKDEEKMERWNE